MKLEMVPFTIILLVAILAGRIYAPLPPQLTKTLQGYNADGSSQSVMDTANGDSTISNGDTFDDLPGIPDDLPPLPESWGRK